MNTNSYERPKGVLKVRGEVLIERQIRQLKDAGIGDIVVVVGYKKERFFYLEDMFGIKLVINEDYATRNNNPTIYKVRELLGNTYICSSDDYFSENPFEAYVYDSYYAATYQAGPTEEYCLFTKGKNDLIVDVLFPVLKILFSAGGSAKLFQVFRFHAKPGELGDEAIIGLELDSCEAELPGGGDVGGRIVDKGALRGVEFEFLEKLSVHRRVGLCFACPKRDESAVHEGHEREGFPAFVVGFLRIIRQVENVVASSS